MPARKPSPLPGTYRLARDVVRDLLRDATPKAERTPKRPDHAVTPAGNRVLSVVPGLGSHTVTITLSESDAIRLRVAARDFMARGAKARRKAEGEIALPIGANETSATLRVVLDVLPDGIAPGIVLSSLRVTFALDALAELPTIVALAGKLALAEAEVTVAPVSLAPITFTDISDSDIGLKPDPIAQERAERWLMAAIAFQNRRKAA